MGSFIGQILSILFGFEEFSLRFKKLSGMFQVGRVSSITNFCLFKISKYRFQRTSGLISFHNYLLCDWEFWLSNLIGLSSCFDLICFGVRLV